MNSLIIHISIVLLHLCILINLTTSELGISSCRYSASSNENEHICHEHPVKLKYLPNECTSFVYDGFTCYQDYNIIPNKPHDDDNIKKIIDHEKDKDTPRSVYSFFSHGNQDDWKNTLCFGDIDKIVQSVNTFILANTVNGLILSGIGNPVSCPNKNFYQVFSNYVEAIKKKIPTLKIGLYLSARTLVECLNNNNNCFNFIELNRFIDFYLFEFTTFNKCDEEFVYGGITPYESSDPNIMTLKRFQDALQPSGILKNNIYLEFLIRPIPIPGVSDNFRPCEYSYGEYCQNEAKKKKGHWCVDSNQMLYIKGQFARNISSGFVARDIDLVDRDAKCKCNDENKFFSFFMLLNGYTGENPLKCKQLK